MKKKSVLPILTLVIVVAVSMAIWNPSSQTSLLISSVEIEGVSVNVELAQTNTERWKGLSGRSTLAEDSGMLFVFKTDGQHGFWMKDMFFPIDIIWINKDEVVVHVETAVAPESYPNVYEPILESRYVLEVNAGFSDEHMISVGDEVSFE